MADYFQLPCRFLMTSNHAYNQIYHSKDKFTFLDIQNDVMLNSEILHTFIQRKWFDTVDLPAINIMYHYINTIEQEKRWIDDNVYSDDVRVKNDTLKIKHQEQAFNKMMKFLFNFRKSNLEIQIKHALNTIFSKKLIENLITKIKSLEEQIRNAWVITLKKQALKAMYQSLLGESPIDDSQDTIELFEFKTQCLMQWSQFVRENEVYFDTLPSNITNKFFI